MELQKIIEYAPLVVFVIITIVVIYYIGKDKPRKWGSNPKGTKL